jgi:hypothetical protein
MGSPAAVGAGMSSLRKRLFPRMDTTMGTNLTGLFDIYCRLSIYHASNRPKTKLKFVAESQHDVRK